MKKLLPLTTIVKAHNAKNDAIQTIISFCLILIGTIGVLILVAIAGDQARWWIRVIPATIFSLMTILQLIEVYRKVKVLAEIALQAANNYDEEFNARNMAEFDLSVAQARVPR